MKLSEPQEYMLTQAALKAEKDAVYSNPENGWFYPNRYETAAVFGTVKTASILCGLGLLEYRTVAYYHVKGLYQPMNEYRITDTGKGRGCKNVSTI